MTAQSLKRVSLYLLIIFLGAVLVWQLAYFIPGFLLAVTFYILLRNAFFRLVHEHHWKRPLAALAIIFLIILVLSVPVWLIIQILIPKFTYLVHNSEYLMSRAVTIVDEIRDRFPQVAISETQVQDAIQKLVAFIPGILGTTAGIFTNLLTAFFVVYFMFVNGEEMEQKLSDFFPLKEESRQAIWQETHNLIVSNALGIPILAFLQAVVAAAGYWAFGVDQFLLWGLLTGVCSLLPVIGTMIVWVPIAIYLIAIDRIGAGVGLTLYSAVVISNIDNVLRFTVMKKIGNVHPLITVFGVIVGLQLFGIMGLIFGPLLLSYFLLLIKAYRLEFSDGRKTLIQP
jgi:predicted PurR-regulated permease PerM